MSPEVSPARLRFARIADALWTVGVAGCGVVFLWAALAQLSRPVGIEPAVTVAQAHAVAAMELRRPPVAKLPALSRTAKLVAAPVTPVRRMHATTGIAAGGYTVAGGHALRPPARAARVSGRVTSGASKPVAVATRPVAARAVAALPAAARTVPARPVTSRQAFIAVRPEPQARLGRPSSQRQSSQRQSSQRPAKNQARRPRPAYVATAVVPFEPPRWFDPTPEFARAVPADPPLSSSALGGIRVRGRELVVPASQTPVAGP